MSKRVNPFVPEAVLVQEQVEKCKRLSQEKAAYAIVLPRKAMDEGISEKEYKEIHKREADRLSVAYREAMNELFNLDKTQWSKTSAELTKLDAERAKQREANDSELAEQRARHGIRTQFTDIVHVLSARLSELEGHVCIKVNHV